MLHHLPRSFPHHLILRYALDTYYGCLQSSYICGHKDSTLPMLHHLPRSFPHHLILRYALDTYYGCLQSSYICGHKDSTLPMLHHLPRSFPHHLILRYALDTYYGCLQSSYICGHKGFRHLCCSTNSAMLPYWLLYMVFRKPRSITYFARKPSRMMITCSQGNFHFQF
ncbi:uncharacterized protein LOC143305095 isoform X2 [Bombus vancouverensis nearcticus]